MDMHKLLEKVIESLSSENSLSSWTVYQENNGYISLKIRYLEGSCETNHNNSGHFRRKSQRQVNRDRVRQEQWRASRQPVTAAQHHPDQSDITVSDTPHAPSITMITDIGCINIETHQDIESVSPAVTRSITRAVLVTLDTPETMRHDDTGDSPTMDISTSSLDINHVSRLDRVSSDTEVNSAHERISVDHDSCHGYDTDPRSEHGGDPDDITQDAPDDNTDDYPDDIKPGKSQEWEPPPGWSWSCWFAKPDKCDQHS